MKFGLKLSDNLEIVLGEFKEEVLEKLQESNVKYTIAFDKVNEEGIKETIIQLPDLRVEVSIENDILSYIKSGCNEYSIIFDGTNVNRKDIAVINNLKATILNHFGIDKKQMFIEKINLRNFDTLIVFTAKDNRKIRLHLMSDLRGNVYINTLRYM